MAKERTFTGTIQTIDGKKRFVPNYPSLWQYRLSKCPENASVAIDFKEVKKVRSLGMNRLYWLYLGVIEADTGNDVDDLHRLFKKSFLPYSVKEMFGEKMLQLTSTTELSTPEFSEYLAKIERLTGVPLPDVDGWKNERDSAPTL